jgi:hypothetical protein
VWWRYIANPPVVPAAALQVVGGLGWALVAHLLQLFYDLSKGHAIMVGNIWTVCSTHYRPFGHIWYVLISANHSVAADLLQSDYNTCLL